MMRSRIAWAACSAATLAACAVGPDYRPPSDAAPPAWFAPLPQDVAHGGSVQGLAAWWSSFDDPMVGELVGAAERSSPTLAAALARIEQSRANAAAARAGLFPSLDAKGQVIRSSTSEAFPQQTSAQVSLDALWELDLFGGVRRGREAALARYQGAQAQWHDARVSLAADTALEYVNLRACQALAALADADLASRRESDRLTQLKVKAGFESPANAALAQASVADAATRLSAQKADCDVSVKALVALTGIGEGDLRTKLAAGAAHIPAPSSFAVDSVPAHALAQRPDLAAAERAVAAASADIGGAQAARFPSITLTGSVGSAAVRTGGQTFTGATWSIGPAIDLPIFDAGRRAASVDAARARYDEALANYRARASQAVREVEQALVRLSSATEREADAARAADGYDQVLRAATDRWRIGTGSLIDVEDARRVAVNARTQLLGVQRERVAAWIGLYRAVGGGWTADAPTPDTQGASAAPRKLQ